MEQDREWKDVQVYFSANSTRKYIDILDELVEEYKNTKHSSRYDSEGSKSKEKRKWNLEKFER